MRRGLLFLSGLLLCSALWADNDDFKLIEQTLDSDGVERLQLDVHVGEVDIETTAGDKIEVEIRVYGRERWFGWRNSKYQDAELEVRRSKDEIRLKLDDDEYREEWLVRVPAHLALNVDMGVGDIEISGSERDLSLDLGVGDARVSTQARHYGHASSDVGVGDTSILAKVGDSSSKRAIVSAQSDWHGDGSAQISVDVGVGDATIRLD